MGNYGEIEHWSVRVPKELYLAHLGVCQAIYSSLDVSQSIEHMIGVWDPESEVSRAIHALSQTAFCNLGTYYQQFAFAVAELHEATGRAQVALSKVEEEFAASLPEVAEYRYTTQRGETSHSWITIKESWHSTGLAVADEILQSIEREFGSGMNSAHEGFVAACKSKGADLGQVLAEIHRPDHEESMMILSKARKELFIAWKRKYPTADAEYETLDSGLPEVQEYLKAEERHREKPPRPAYARDHRWLDWNQDEKLSPAKIRDRWDAMSVDERKGICHSTCDKIGDGGKNPGRAIVVTALKKAKKERGL